MGVIREDMGACGVHENMVRGGETERIRVAYTPLRGMEAKVKKV